MKEDSADEFESLASSSSSSSPRILTPTPSASRPVRRATRALHRGVRAPSRSREYIVISDDDDDVEDVKAVPILHRLIPAMEADDGELDLVLLSRKQRSIGASLNERIESMIEDGEVGSGEDVEGMVGEILEGEGDETNMRVGKARKEMVSSSMCWGPMEIGTVWIGNEGEGEGEALSRPP